MKLETPDLLTGVWTYRSFLNTDDLSIDNTLNTNPPPKFYETSFQFGNGYIRIAEAGFGQFRGKIFGPKNAASPNPVDQPYGWELDLKGSINYGDPFSVCFEGKGIVGGSEWIYQYTGYLIKPWPNGVNQVPALVGSIVRVIPHPSDGGGTAPAGVVCSWFAVKYGVGNGAS